MSWTTRYEIESPSVIKSLADIITRSQVGHRTVSHRNGGVRYRCELLWLRNFRSLVTSLLCTFVYRNGWPFDHDEPTISVDLSCNLKVTFEFVEVRPMLRNGPAAKGMCEAAGDSGGAPRRAG